MSTSKTEGTWYVYLLCDPDTGQPFYVGKGTLERINIHERLWKSDTNKKKKEIIQRIQSAGKEVLKRKIAEFDNEQDAYIYEWATICTYSGQITNIKDGGVGKRSHSKNERRASTVDPLWTIEDVANYLQIPTNQVLQQYGLPCIDFGRKKSDIRFVPQDVRAWANQNKAAS